MAQQTRAKKSSTHSQNTSRNNSQESQELDASGPQDLLSSITPAFQEARRYIEGSPVRAAAIGAVAGAAIMTIFSTEKGRQFARLAYDYANPVVSKYAKEYISKAAGDMTENALSQH